MDETVDLDVLHRQLEICKLEAELRQAEVDLDRSRLELADAQRLEEKTRAGNDEHLHYTFNDTVTETSVAKTIDTLTRWSRRRPGQPIRIVFNSPGGSVIDGLALYDFLRQLRRDGHHLTTVALGMAASMAGVLLQAGDTRKMGANAFLLIHEVSSVGRGKASELEDEVRFVKRLQDQLLTILAERASLSKTQIRRRWSRKDWWLDSTEAIRYGFADSVD